MKLSKSQKQRRPKKTKLHPESLDGNKNSRTTKGAEKNHWYYNHAPMSGSNYLSRSHKLLHNLYKLRSSLFYLEKLSYHLRSLFNLSTFTKP